MLQEPLLYEYSLEEAADYLLDEREEVPDTSTFDVWIAEDTSDIGEVAEVSCLEDEDREDYERIASSGGIQYALFSLGDSDEIDGYSRGYLLKNNDETIYTVVPLIFHELESKYTTEANKLAKAAHFLNAEKMDVDAYAIGTDIEVSDRYSDQAEKVEEEAEFMEEPVKYPFSIESERLRLHEF